MISKFSNPDPELLIRSSGALYLCKYLGQRGLMVVDAKCITSVVAMVELPRFADESPSGENGNRGSNGETMLSENKRYFLVEKVGVEILGSTEVNDLITYEE